MRILLYSLLVTLVACTTFEQVGSPGAQLHADIRAGKLINAGDEVRITTADGQVYSLEVTAITPAAIEGKRQSIPIDTVTAVEVRQLSPERAVAVSVASLAVSWWLLGLMLSALVFMP